VTPDLIFFTCDNILLAWSVYAILMTGNLSFAQAGFMSVGCYVAGLVTTKFGFPLWAAMFAAMVVGATMAAVIGYPALKIRGIYLILVTTGVTFSVRVALENWSYAGGAGGLSGMTGVDETHAVTAVFLVGLFLWIVSRSPLQRVLDVVREDDQLACALGVDITYVKVIAFAFGAAIASLAGALYGHYMVFVRPSSFDILVSITVALYVILGGVNNLWGPAVGAAIMTLLPEFIRPLQSWRPTFFGVAIIIMLLVRPDGLLPFRTVSARWNKREDTDE